MIINNKSSVFNIPNEFLNCHRPFIWVIDMNHSANLIRTINFANKSIIISKTYKGIFILVGPLKLSELYT